MKRMQIAGIIITVFVGLLFSQSTIAQVETAYVTNFNDMVSVINTQTNIVETRFSVSSLFTTGIAVDSTCTFGYLTDGLLNVITKINLISGDTVETANVGAFNLGSPVLSPDDSVLYANGDERILVIDPMTLAVVDDIPLPQDPLNIAITPDGSKLFVSSRVIQQYYVIDTATNTLIETVMVPGANNIGIFTISPDGQRAYLTDFSPGPNAVIIISTATNQIIGGTPPPAGIITPTGLFFVPDGSKAYLTDFNGNNIAQFDPVGNIFTSIIPFGNVTQNMGFTQDAIAYLPIDIPPMITVFDTNTNQIIDQIPGDPDDFPFDVAICALPDPADLRSVPTISEWGAIIMVGLFAIAAVIFLRRRATIVER